MSYFATQYGLVRLTEGEYNELKDKPQKEIDDFVEARVSDAVRYGYGYYGFRTFGKDACGYYAQYSMGTHCD